MSGEPRMEKQPEGEQKFESWLKEKDFTPETVSALLDKGVTSQNILKCLSQTDIDDFKLNLGQRKLLENVVKTLTARETEYDISVTGQTGGEAKQVKSIGILHSRPEETGQKVANKYKVVGQEGGKADTVDAYGETDAKSLSSLYGMVWKEEYDTPLRVVLCDEKNTETQKLFQDNQVYNMRKHPKGLVLIVNNYKFEDGSTREGTNVDASKLDELFTEFGFKVIQKDDLKAQKIKDEFLDRVKDCHDGSYNCFVGIILSHGRHGGVVGTDRGFVETKEIMDLFQGDKCPGLLEKPKLFFIQACQGKGKDSGCEVDDNCTINDELLEDMHCEEDSPGCKISGFAHFFLGVSTVPGYVSYRGRPGGSFFIAALVHVFSKFAAKYDLNQLMTRVNNEVVASRSKKEYVQVSKFESTLLKSLYFFPGMPPKSS